MVPEKYHWEREYTGLTVGCVAVFLYLFAITFTDYVKSVQKNKYVEFDLNTITAGDYTVEFDISPKFYATFVEQYLDKSNPIPEVMQLKLFLKSELERRLTQMPAQGLDGPEGDVAPVKIATLALAFDNAQVIKWLRTRGTHIKNEDWAKLEKINETIQVALKTQEGLLDKL